MKPCQGGDHPEQPITICKICNKQIQPDANILLTVATILIAYGMIVGLVINI